MPALDYDMHIERGSEYRLHIPVFGEDDLPLLLNGWGLRGEIRSTSGSPYALYDLSGSLSITDDRVHVAVTILAQHSEPWEWRQGVYDIELIDQGGSPYRLIQGRVFVSPEVTR